MATDVTPVDVGPKSPTSPRDIEPNGRPVQQGDNGNGPPVIYEPAAPVMVDGKKASDMTDDELHEFLAQKIKKIDQSEDGVELLHVAPGYGLTMTFDDSINGVILGDGNLISYTQKGRLLQLFAKDKTGDTSMKLVFPDNKILSYHVFVAPNYGTADSLIKVSSGDLSDGETPKSSVVGPNDELDIGAITKIVANYDAMSEEKAIDTRTVRRIPVFRKSQLTSFNFYYIYQFKNGPVAISFSYTNPYKYAIRNDESALRIQVGSMQFVPDYVSFQQTTLQPGEATTGFAVLASSPFSFKQPFELIWK